MSPPQTERFTFIITNTLHAVVQFQLNSYESFPHLFKYPTNKNHHDYLQDPFKTWVTIFGDLLDSAYLTRVMLRKMVTLLESQSVLQNLWASDGQAQ